MLCAVLFCACEGATDVMAASFSDISISGADSYGIAVKFSEDKRIEDKYYDIQVRANKPIAEMQMWEDGGKKYKVSFDEKDEWQSLTTMFALGEGKPGTEKFIQMKEALGRRIMFSSTEKVNLTFRVVVGESVDNRDKTGKVIVSTEPISSEFTLKIDRPANNLED